MIEKIPTEVQMFLMAAFVAFLRVVYDKKETKPVRVLLETMLCGFLGVGVGSAVLALGLDVRWTIFSSCIIGFLGTMLVREIAIKFIKSKIK